jgi:hypothetical protein
MYSIFSGEDGAIADVNIQLAEHVACFVDVFSRRIFLDERDERIASLGQLAFLAELRGCLKFRQAYVRCRCRRDFATLLLFHGDFLFDKSVVAEPGGATEDRQRKYENEKPPHDWKRTSAPVGDGRKSAFLWLDETLQKESIKSTIVCDDLSARRPVVGYEASVLDSPPGKNDAGRPIVGSSLLLR